MAATYITKRYDRLDRICYDYYGSTANGEVEFVLAHNPRLAEQSLVLPIGLTIELPDRPVVRKEPKVITQVMLWD